MVFFHFQIKVKIKYKKLSTDFTWYFVEKKFQDFPEFFFRVNCHFLFSFQILINFSFLFWKQKKEKEKDILFLGKSGIYKFEGLKIYYKLWIKCKSKTKIQIMINFFSNFSLPQNVKYWKKKNCFDLKIFKKVQFHLCFFFKVDFKR